MAKLKMRKKEEDVQKLLQEYWETLEPEKISNHKVSRENGRTESGLRSNAKHPAL